MSKKTTYIFCIIAPFVLFIPEIISGRTIYWGLPILQFYPWRQLAFDTIVNGQLPLWNPYNGLGTPLLANYQSALIYPGTWIIFLFYLFGNMKGLVWGHLFINILHLSIAGIGVLKIGEFKKYSYPASAIAALSFSLCGYFLARFGFFSMIWAGIWFPWVFLYTLKMADEKAFSKNGLYLSFVIAIMLLSGHAQLSWYIILFSFIFLVFQFRNPVKAWAGKLLNFIIANLIAVGISAIQLIPTAKLLLHSQRSDSVGITTAMTYSFWPWHILNFLNPHIFGHPITGDYWGYGAYWEDATYMGLLPVLLAISVIVLVIRKKVKTGWKNRELLFFTVMSIIGLVFALGNNTGIFPFFYKAIPTFDMFNAPARYMIWVIFSLSLLAGYAFDFWYKPHKKVLYWVRLSTAGGVAIGIGALFMLLTGDAIKPTFISATFQISLFCIGIGVLYLINPINPESEENIKAKIWKITVVCFVFFDLVAMNIRHIPVDAINDVEVFEQDNGSSGSRIYTPEDVDYDLRYNAVLNFDDYGRTFSNEGLFASQIANVNILSRTTSLNNFEPMRLGTYDQFISALNKKTKDEQMAILENYSINKMGALKQSFSETSEQPIFGYIDIPEKPQIQFYSNQLTVPSVHVLLDSIREKPCIYRLDTSTGNRNSVDKSCGPIEASVSNLFWQGNIISFNIDMPENGFALVNDTYDQGWRLTIDGVSSPIDIANGFVKSFAIPAGSHEIKLRYLPNSFILGGVISFASLILTSILLYRMKKIQ